MSLEDLERPIPIAFDYATFRYYLQLEILQQTALAMGWVDDNEPYRNAQPVYDAMTDEVLLRMGYTHPLQVPEDEIREMMVLGRVEAWRAVVHNTVTDTDVTIGLNTLLRKDFHNNAITQWSLAQQEYNNEFPPDFQEATPISTPATRTYAGAVVPRW